MITEPGLRWILTVLFAAAGAFCLYRCVRRTGWNGRVADALHAAMCVGMVTMAWPATMTFARIPQVVLFAAAAGWFAVSAAWGFGHGRLPGAHHALMMAGMAWMAFAMPSAMAGMTMSAAAMGGEHAGMDMGDASMTMTGHAPAQVVVVAAVLAVVFLVAGIAWLARAIDHARTVARPGRREIGLVMEGVMSLGMSVMAVAMI
ncbi:DUF5134 domain-containing protein [Amycolatopsis sp. AA4]|uniref:DUF5134 domain-containing protein n=1 Tax=Actinomycetes TaxID=1760 RepID=UPI0001B53FE1|nr:MULTISPECIES: DUF5134 domain-containing protein [Actinomycetes]ATY11516.1 DUF5134 domain-containing protein [Amycolatopsis sp. AA4]EFL07151.1 predicted protein [Streptomyces sp. AA4]